jgi:sensor c-di-GMP phosphodiesterase-like protein
LAELGEQLRQRPGFRVTINVSAHDLLDVTFATFLRNEFRTANVPADSIGFELTERSTAERSAIARGIQRLRELGHKVYIDDFGTDYSSLSYLAHLHVDAIKIDRLFTLALHETGHGASIAPQIVAMAEALGLILVIEGIEEESQAAYFLKLDQKALAQGWLFGKPVPADRLFVVDDDGVGPVP